MCKNSQQGFYVPNFMLLLSKDMNDPSSAEKVLYPLMVDTIITDYLKHIGELALTEIIKNCEGEGSFIRDYVQWCVTVPSIWDENGKQRLKKCMVDAGLVSAGGRMESVKVALKAEAASYYCNLHFFLSLHVKDKIMVVDIGGRTVDIVVQEVIRSGKDFKVQELTEISSSLCGGTFVDEAFMRFLSSKIGCLDPVLRSGDGSHILHLLNCWEEIKRAFGDEVNSRSDSYAITVPEKFAWKWEAYEKNHGYPWRKSYSKVELSQQNVMFIFDPVVDEILRSIALQLVRVRDIKVVFVVGGFAGYPYLMERIRGRFSRDVTHIFRPLDPGSARVPLV